MSEPFILHHTALPPLEIAEILEREQPALDRYLGEEIYVNTDPSYIARQRERMIATARLHAERVGDRPTILLRAPGRLNAFLEYLDMCAGDHMSATIDGDIPVALSAREDDLVKVANSNPMFPPEEFSISEEAANLLSAPWTGPAVEGLPDNWDTRTRVYPYYKRTRGDWLNYVRSSFLRVAWEAPEIPLRGVDMTFGPSTVPARAGTSSSSAVVVLSLLSLLFANQHQLPKWSVRQLCKLLGEAEWYVGTHGGANDQTTILRNIPNGVLYNRHSLPLLDSTPLPCLRGVRVVVANSLWEANKALDANHRFNLRKGWMDLGDDLLKLIISNVGTAAEDGEGQGPGWIGRLLAERFGISIERDPRRLEAAPGLWSVIRQRYARFGSLDEGLLGVSTGVIDELISLLPAEISPQEAGWILGKDQTALERDYTLPNPGEGGYEVRAAATFFHKENQIGRRLEQIFQEADERVARGEIALDSREYDAYRLEVGQYMDKLQDTLRDDFQVSNGQLDMLLEISRRGPGYLGGKLTGAGSGGCVSILVREGTEQAHCEWLDREYYGKNGNFDRYRAVLDALARDATDDARRASADEMQQNLRRALAAIPDQRRVVTFSRGAGPLEVWRFR